MTVFDMWQLSQGLYEQGSKVYRQVVEQIGREVLDEHGNISRKQLGEIVFSDKSKRQALDRIVRTPIRNQLIRHIVWEFVRGTPLLILDSALLFESGLNKFVSKTIVVHCDRDVQVRRLCARGELAL